MLAGSVGKTFAAATALQLVKEGKIGLRGQNRKIPGSSVLVLAPCFMVSRWENTAHRIADGEQVDLEARTRAKRSTQLRIDNYVWMRLLCRLLAH